MNYNCSIGHIVVLRLLILERNLSTPERFDECPNVTLRHIYNGIGPESWSGSFRRFVTFLLSLFEAEALIHDYEYTYSSRSYYAFSIANLRFAYNAVVSAFVESGFNKLSSKRAGAGVILALICQFFGWRGYKNSRSAVFEK